MAEKEGSNEKKVYPIEVPLFKNLTKSNTKKRNKKISAKKRLMIKKLIKRRGVITFACLDAGISRFTHYHWLKTDSVYKDAVSQMGEVVDDLIENSLLNLVEEENHQAVIHAAKTRLRKRGYGEQIRIEHAGQVAGNLSVNVRMTRELPADLEEDAD